ncbi:MAG: hypothetical protein RR425_02285 [Erysipelotrichales bacterium]
MKRIRKLLVIPILCLVFIFSVDINAKSTCTNKGKVQTCNYNYTKTNQSDWKSKRVTYYKSDKSEKKNVVKRVYLKRNNKLKYTSNVTYFYNNVGQLKTNKFGKAKRIEYKYNNKSKVNARRISTYDGKGKLKKGKWNTKAYIKSKKKKFKGNSKPLKLKTAYKTSQAVHPSLIDMKKKYRGYRFYMAITPYPKHDSSKENPHFYRSNNLVDWYAPSKTTNPIDKAPRGQYNSDTHLIFNNTNKRFEMFWRRVNKGKITIYHSTSTNGIKWTPKKAIMESKMKQDALLSPAVILEKGIYKMWYIDFCGNVYQTSSRDLRNWTPRKLVKINYSNKKTAGWHLDVKKENGRYEMLVNTFYKKGKANTPIIRKNMNLMFTTSKNGLNFGRPKQVLKPTKKANDFDANTMYRSSAIKVNGKYVVIYSAFGSKGKTGSGIAYGKSIDKVKRFKDKKSFIRYVFKK